MNEEKLVRRVEGAFVGRLISKAMSMAPRMIVDAVARSPEVAKAVGAVTEEVEATARPGDDGRVAGRRPWRGWRVVFSVWLSGRWWGWCRFCLPRMCWRMGEFRTIPFIFRPLFERVPM
jgi:hypothetical protein